VNPKTAKLPGMEEVSEAAKKTLPDGFKYR
jgi:hypothetical protein